MIDVTQIPEVLALDDTAAVILSYLSDEILRKLYITGIVPRLSSVLTQQQFWHARVETLSQLRTPFAVDVDWRETYYIIMIQDPYNDRDNATATDILNRMGIRSRIVLAKAARYGQIKIVSYLLAKSNINPDEPILLNMGDEWDGYGEPLIHAARGGHTSVFALLLSDPRVYPTNGGRYNYVLNFVCLARRHDMLQLLIKDGRVSDNEYKRAISDIAVSSDDAETVRILLSCVRPSDANLCMAIHYGREQIVAALLEDGRIDPRCDNAGVLFSAVERGWIGVVRALLADPRVDPTVENNRALNLALDLNSDENAAIATLLLMNDRVRELFCSRS